MKFGRYFHQYMDPGCEGSYLNYTACKNLFKNTCRSVPDGANTANFEALDKTLSKELQKVESCYVDRLDRAQRGIAALRTWYGLSGDEYNICLPLQQIRQEELQTLLRKCFNLQSKLEEVYQYGYMNRQGFCRIYDKLIRVGAQQGHVFVRDNSFAASFMIQKECLVCIRGLHKFITALWTTSVCDPPDSATSSVHLKTLERPLYPSLDSIEDFCRAINQNDTLRLRNILVRQERTEPRLLDEATQPLLFHLLEYAILCLSSSSADVLIEYIQAVAPADPNGTGNIFHRLTESIGLASRPVDANLHRNAFLLTTNNIANRAQLASDVVHALAENVRPALNTKDCFGRLPLHYASLYGLTGLCSAYIEHMVPTHETSSAEILQLFSATDIYKYTCLDLSILSGHLQTTQRFLTFLQSAITVDGVECIDELENLIGQAINIALRCYSGPKRLQLIRYLLSLLPRRSQMGLYGKMDLYFAASHGCQDVLQDIVAKSAIPQELVNTLHPFHCWTPLIIACVEGHSGGVTTLIQSGADSALSDAQGWTAQEHAAFRGHLDIAESLVHRTPGEKVQPDQEETTKVESRSPLRGLPLNWHRRPVAEEKTQILLTLGPSNSRSNKQVADISPLLIRQDGSLSGLAGYALWIDSIYANGPKPFIRLPLLEDTINDPWWFSIDDTERAGFIFNLVQLDDLNREDGTLVASAIAVLKDTKRGFSFQHESLERDYTIPLLQKETLALAGTVTFSFLSITPLPCPKAPLESRCGFWKTGTPTQVVGHRGSGANTAAHNNLQIGENTVQSFLSAAASGASCVEFDVQLTKDWVPVIFHDFLIMETGADTPLHTLTLSQFLHLADSQAYRGEVAGIAETRYSSNDKANLGNKRRPRSRSLGVYDQGRSEDMMTRMSLTDEGMHKPLKGNVRGLAIQEMFPTFEELFKRLPDDIAFNVELKYPMLWEAEDRSMETSAPEINLFVDIILSTIYKHGGKRNITLTSFSPEICILLAVKQQRYPVLFINKAGSVPTGDIRAANLQQAIRFAKKWNLAGIVMLADVFVLCPRLVGYAKSQGLVVATYGDLNDKPECAVIQAKAGVDALIANKVKLISQTLASLSRSK